MDERGDLYRKSLRLAGHDYKSDGAYFITIVSHARKCIFGDVIKDKIILSTYGEIAQAEWFASKDIRKEIELFNDELVIMPNHLHGIVWIFSNPNDFMLPKTTSKVRVGATGRSPLPSGGKLDAGITIKIVRGFYGQRVLTHVAGCPYTKPIRELRGQMSRIGSKKSKNSLRLEGFDYSKEGAYYVTLVAYEHQYIFGKVASGVVLLTEFGQIAHDEWFESSKVRSEIVLYEDELIVMPNHIHGIVWIEPCGRQENGIKKSNQPLVRATGRLPIHNAERNEPGPRTKSLSAFIAGYKSAVTKRINQLRRTPGRTIWMPNFHDRVIRNKRELIAIREYIQNNPMKWELDRNYVE